MEGNSNVPFPSRYGHTRVVLLLNTRATALVVGLILTSCLGHADDGWVYAVGGSAKLMKSHPAIRMKSEYVHIKAPEGKVRAEFVFANDGPATDVTMGFPEEGKPEKEGEKPKSCFDYFRSYVDGKQVKCQLVPSTESDDQLYRFWWVKKVHFRAKQTIKVIVEYGNTIAGNTSGENWISYTLATGASWKGKIGYAKIVAEIGKLKRFCVRGEPRHYQVHGKQITWEFRDFEPSEKNDTDCVQVSWLNGFTAIAINGVNIQEKLRPVTDDCSQGIWPQLDNDELTAPIEAIADWIGGDIERHRDARKLTWKAPNGKMISVTARTNSKLLEATTKNRTMLKPAKSVDFEKSQNSDRLVVRVGPVIRALGGKAYFDKKSMTYRITLKGARPLRPTDR